MSDLESYLNQLLDFADSLRPYLKTTDFDLIKSLISHNEGGEALLTLSWIMVEDEIRVPAKVISDIRTLSAGLIDADELPPHLERQTLD